MAAPTSLQQRKCRAGLATLDGGLGIIFCGIFFVSDLDAKREVKYEDVSSLSSSYQGIALLSTLMIHPGWLVPLSSTFATLVDTGQFYTHL